MTSISTSGGLCECDFPRLPVQNAYDLSAHPRTRRVATPYFRDISKMRHHKGKSFLANSKLFRADAALFFPNLQGKTLASTREAQDTTPVLRGKVSVVGIYSSAWAEQQVETFLGVKQNPDLHQILQANGTVAQQVEINVEQNWFKALLVRLFFRRLRRLKPQKNWGKYFLVRRGLTEFIRLSMGYLNSRVGYVYLLDQECKIRWVASGRANEDEKEHLLRGLKRLVTEGKAPQ